MRAVATITAATSAASCTAGSRAPCSPRAPPGKYDGTNRAAAAEEAAMRAVATITAAACYSLLPHGVQPVLVLHVVHWRHLANTMERTVRLRRRRLLLRAVAAITAAACYSLLPHGVQPVLVLHVVLVK